jgi:ABC-2 type transport system permease protein
MLYTVTVLAMILTGNILVGILGTLVFNFYTSCVLAVLELSYHQFFYTSYQGGKAFFGSLTDRFSPFFLFVTNSNKMQSGEFTGEIMVRVAAVICVTIILAVLSYWLYKKRGSEAAGKAMAFKVSMPIIRIPIVILAALCGSLFFWFIHSSLGWAVFGLICGVVLSHCFIEIIYHFDFRKLFSHWKQMIVSAVLAAAVFCCFRYDFIGYDSYIPTDDSIKSIGISFENTNDWISYGDIWQDAEGDYNWEYQSSNEYILSHMELNDTAPVLALVRDAVERNQRLRLSNSTVRNSEEYERTYRFSVRYTMKNGKNTYRTYELSGDNARPEIVRIYENPDFLNAVYPVLTQTPEDTAWVRVARGAQKNVVSLDRNGTDKAMTEKILKVYQEDLKNLKVETMQKENPIASIQFVTRKQAAAETKRAENQNSWKYSDVTERGYYPIYPSFKNTMELLKECQVDVDSWNDLEQIKEINIDKTQFANFNYTYESKEAQYLTITDPEILRQIMEKAAIEEYSGMNPFVNNSFERISFSAVAVSGGSKSEMQYTIPLDQLPKSVSKDIDKIKNDA